MSLDYHLRERNANIFAWGICFCHDGICINIGRIREFGSSSDNRTVEIRILLDLLYVGKSNRDRGSGCNNPVKTRFMMSDRHLN